MSAYLGLAVRLVASDALWAVVASAFAVIPGLGLALGLGRRLGWGWPPVLALAVTTSSALAGVAGMACHYLHLSLLVASIAFLALSALAWAGGVRLGRGLAMPDLERAGLLAGAAAALLAIVEGPYMAVTGDTFYHLAAIRSLLVRDIPMVTDPFYGTNVTTLDPTSGIWHTMLAMWSRLTGLDPVGPWIGMTAVGAAGLVLALWGLLRWVSRSSKWATWGVAGYVLFSLFTDVRAAGLPRNGSLFIVFTAMLAFLTLLEQRRWSAVAVALIGGFAAFTVHLGSALLLFVAIGAIGLWLLVDTLVAGLRDHAWDWRPLGALAGAGVLCGLSAASTLLPKLTAMAAPAGGSSGGSVFALNSPDDMVRPVRWPGGLVSFDPASIQGSGLVLAALVVVLLVLMAMAAFGRSHDRAALGGLALAGLPALLLYNPLVASVLYKVSPYMAGRVIFIMPFTTWVAIAWGLARAGDAVVSRAARWVAYAGLAVALVMGTPFVVNTWTGKGGLLRRGSRYPIYVTRLVDMRYEWGLDTLARFRGAIGARYPRIAGDLESTYYMSGLEPVCTLAALRSHSPFVVEQASGEQRRADNEEIIAPGTADSRRAALLAKWDVSYVVLRLDRRDPAASAEALRGSSVVRVAIESPKLVIFEVVK